MRPHSPYRENVLALRAEGLSCSRIARRLLLTKGQVSGIVHRAGVRSPKPAKPARPPKPAPEWTVGSLSLLRTLSTGGATLNHMAARMGVSKAECDRALWALVGRTPETALVALNERKAA